jgi:hypothetical protein
VGDEIETRDAMLESAFSKHIANIEAFTYGLYRGEDGYEWRWPESKELPADPEQKE